MRGIPGVTGAYESMACRPFVKPLVLLTPKYLLHHRPATSALADFTGGTFFNRVIDDSKASPGNPLAGPMLKHADTCRSLERVDVISHKDCRDSGHDAEGAFCVLAEA